MIFDIHLYPETDLEKKNKRINELSKIIGNGSDKKLDKVCLLIFLIYWF